MEKVKLKEFLQSLADAGGTKMVELKGELNEKVLKDLKEKEFVSTVNKGQGNWLEISLRLAGRRYLE